MNALWRDTGSRLCNVFLVLFLTGCLLPVGPTVAFPAREEETAKPPESSGGDATTAEQTDLETRHAEVKSRLTRLHQLVEKADVASLQRDVQEELDILSWLDVTYSQLASIQQRKDESSLEIESLREQLESINRFGLTEKPPYSYLLLDQIRDDLATTRDKLQSVDHQQSASQRYEQSVKSRLHESESQRRLTKEQWSDVLNAGARKLLTAKLEQLDLQCQARQALLDQVNEESALRTLESDALQIQMEILQAKQRLVETNVEFSPDDLASRERLLEKAEKEIRDDLSEAVRELARLQRDSTSFTDTTEGALNEETLNRLKRTNLQEEIDWAQQLLQELVVVKAAWRWRYELANGQVEFVQLRDRQETLTSAGERVSAMEQALAMQLDERRDKMLTVRKQRLEENGNSSPILELHTKELDRTVAFLGSCMSYVRGGKRLLQRALDETQASLNSDSGASTWATIGYWLNKARNYEIAVVEGRSVTIGKVLFGIALLFGGLLLARLLSRLLGRRLLPRLGVNETGSSALQAIAFYVLLCSFALMVLDFVNFPITAFAFMGGAIAIGIGFGSQNILNNFISGLIILAERPIRPGDLIEIDGLSANIEHIGARSTRVKTGSNLEIVVPNSKFLENNVTNWTLSDTRIRVCVEVGVAYGSPIKEVMRQIRAAVMDHSRVLHDIEPVILFKEFGDNALAFECHFWIHMRTMMEGEQVRSEVRCRIDELFSAADITIAYPQRDVHLDTLQPLEVNLRSIPVQNPDTTSLGVHRPAA